jgi:molybdopterin biosynthesis enzyme MoaB
MSKSRGHDVVKNNALIINLARWPDAVDFASELDQQYFVRHEICHSLNATVIIINIIFLIISSIHLA